MPGFEFCSDYGKDTHATAGWNGNTLGWPPRPLGPTPTRKLSRRWGERLSKNCPNHAAAQQLSRNDSSLQCETNDANRKRTSEQISSVRCLLRPQSRNRGTSAQPTP